MPTSILRLPAVIQRTGLSRSEIYRRIALGQFPKQVPLGVRAMGFDSDAIDAYIADLIKGSHKTAK